MRRRSPARPEVGPPRSRSLDGSTDEAEELRTAAVRLPVVRGVVLGAYAVRARRAAEQARMRLEHDANVAVRDFVPEHDVTLVGVIDLHEVRRTGIVVRDDVRKLVAGRLLEDLCHEMRAIDLAVPRAIGD